VADFLVDTDVFVDHLRGFKYFYPRSHRINYSVVTRAELFAGNSATADVQILLSPFRELDVTRSVAERGGRIRRETGICVPDALIAATAIEHRLSLYTRDRSDFENVRGLRIREDDELDPRKG
jgi:toxin FitB